MTHRFTLRIYYEDTDFGGLVYHANFLKFTERARSEWAREIGIDQRAMKEELGVVYAVRRVEADYLRPAFYDDILTVATRVERLGGASLILVQEVTRGEDLIFTCRVVLVVLGATGPVRLPDDMRRRIAGVMPQG